MGCIPSLRATLAATLAGLALLATAACTPETGAGRESEPAAATVSGPAVRFTAAAAGPVTPGTAYSAQALRALLPGFEVKPIQTATEADVTSALAAFSGGLQVMQFIRGSDGKIGQVFGVSPLTVGPAGERLGMTLSQLGIPRQSCRMGGELWTDMAICPSRGAANVSLVFAVPQYRGPLDQLPPAAELAGAELQRLIWRPAR
ncbi:DUF1131 domain-containing protein [Pseudoxanthobacter sp.]|uniref:DUF1131 domain-containing protein n=1 Tax=Pseudoxanthobacter sp. TaxID=1925742 RepID=UPI002FE00A80